MTLLEKVLVVSDTDSVGIMPALAKTTEELGELAAAVLAFTGQPNVSASADDNVLEEATDLLICALDIAYKAGHTPAQIETMAEVKLQKWIRKIQTNQQSGDREA